MVPAVPHENGPGALSRNLQWPGFWGREWRSSFASTGFEFSFSLLSCSSSRPLGVCSDSKNEWRISGLLVLLVLGSDHCVLGDVGCWSRVPWDEQLWRSSTEEFRQRTATQLQQTILGELIVG